MSYIDLHVRMFSVKSFQTFRCCDDKHTFNILSTMLLDHPDCIYRRTTGCKHRVCQHDQSLFNRIRKFAVIFMWFMCLRISVKADMTDLCRRNQRCDTVYHTKSGTKYRHNCQLLSGDHWGFTFLDRSFNFHILQWKISQCLISHKDCNFFDQFTELICSCIFVTKHRNFVLDQRMIHNKYVFHVFLHYHSL